LRHLSYWCHVTLLDHNPLAVAHLVPLRHAGTAIGPHPSVPQPRTVWHTDCLWVCGICTAVGALFPWHAVVWFLIVVCAFSCVAQGGRTRPVPAELSPQAVAQLYHSCACLQPASCNLGADCVLVCAVRFCTLLLGVALISTCVPLVRQDRHWRAQGWGKVCY
jgi:hypothetical protein